MIYVPEGPWQIVGSYAIYGTIDGVPGNNKPLINKYLRGDFFFVLRRSPVSRQSTPYLTFPNQFVGAFDSALAFPRSPISASANSDFPTTVRPAQLFAANRFSTNERMVNETFIGTQCAIQFGRVQFFNQFSISKITNRSCPRRYGWLTWPITDLRINGEYSGRIFE